MSKRRNWYTARPTESEKKPEAGIKAGVRVAATGWCHCAWRDGQRSGERDHGGALLRAVEGNNEGAKEIAVRDNLVITSRRYRLKHR
jgi:hypothetical protein